MPKEPEIKRVVAFVDGQSLYCAAKDAFGYQRVNYDVSALATAICKQKGWNLVQTRFYTGVPSPLRDSSLSSFWNRKILNMRRQSVHVFSCELKYDERTRKLPDGETEPYYVPREKGVDIRIALDIIKLAHEKAYDLALVFSQDQDFVQVIGDLDDISRQQIRWIKMATAFPSSPHSSNKRGIDRTDWIPFDQATYDACLDQTDYSLKAMQDKAAACQKSN